jgi:hypothetical protein
VRNLRGWLSGLGGAAAVTIGAVVAALIVAGVTPFHGGDGRVKIPAHPRQLALGDQSGVGTAVSTTSGQQRTQASGGTRAGSGHRSAPLAGNSGPVSVRHGGSQAPKPRLPGAGGGGSHDSTSPVSGAPSTSTPAPGGGNPGGGNGGGGGGQQPGSLGDTVKNTTQQLGDTVNGATQTVGNTVGAVSPALGDTVKQTGPALGNTVKGTGDVVNNTVDGLLGGHR